MTAHFYSPAAMRLLARECAERAAEARAAHDKHVEGARVQTTAHERSVRLRCAELAGCTYRHWRRLADQYELAAVELEEALARMAASDAAAADGGAP